MSVGRQSHFASFFATIILLASLALMQIEALSIAGNIGGLRNIAASFLLPALVILILSANSGRRTGHWTAAVVLIFASWVGARVVLDSGIDVISLWLVLWFPLLFFVGYFSRGVSSEIAAAVTVFALLSSAAYLFVALGVGVRGPQAINAIFYPLLAFPFIFSCKRRILSVPSFALVTFAVIASEKRTALVGLVLALVVASLVRLYTNRGITAGPSGLRTAFITIPFATFAYWWLSSYFQLDIFQKIFRTVEDGGSGRQEIAADVIARIEKLPFHELMLGRGHNAVASDLGVSAHNDFLETTYDFGLFSTLILGLFLAFCIIQLLSLAREANSSAPGFAAAIVLFLVMATFSHIIFIPTYVGLISFYIGAAMNRPSLGAVSLRIPVPNSGQSQGVQVD